MLIRSSLSSARRWTKFTAPACRDRLADLLVSFLDQTGAFLDAMPYHAAAYRERTPLMHEIREEGLDL